MTRRGRDVPDHALWEEVKRSINPLLRKSQLKVPSKRLGTPQEILASKPQRTHAPGALPLRHLYYDTPPPLAQFDRRTAQRLGRGQIEPEARLDLHGENMETARIKLLHFLSSQRQLGVRMVLVITGKGASPFARHTLHGTSLFHTPEREGRLRREVPMWLQEDNFRLHTVGFQPAHPRHGGGGAFYLRLRKLG